LPQQALEDEHAATRDRARREMFDLLTAEPEPVAT
jgi:hypothetical protein